MDADRLVKKTVPLEKELHIVRHNILKEEMALLSLEKALFHEERSLEKSLLKEFEETRELESKTKQETKQIKKSLTKKIRRLSSKNKEQKLSNAVLEQQVLQRELESLQRGFKKDLEQMRKQK